MASNQIRRSSYVKENVTFFIEEMIVYILKQKGINLEVKRPEHLQRLRAVATLSFSPSVGDAIITISNINRDLVARESDYIWNYIRRLRCNERKDVLHASLVTYGLRLIMQGDKPMNLFLLMAVVTDLCERFCRYGHGSLLGGAVTSLEFIFNNLVHGGFVRTVISLNNRALNLRLFPSTYI